MVVTYANICIGFPPLWMLITSVSSTCFSKEPSRQDYLKSRYCLKEKEIAFALICSCFLLCLEPKMRDSTCFCFAHFASLVFCADHSHTGRKPTLPQHDNWVVFTQELRMKACSQTQMTKVVSPDEEA